MSKNIILDVGGVLMFYDYKQIISEITRDPSEALFLYKDVINSPEWLGYALLDLGVISLDDAILSIQDRTNHKHDELVKKFLHYSQYARTIEEDMVDEIRDLKDKGFKVYLLSNMPIDRYHHIKTTSSVFSEINGMVLSCFVKKVKPYEGIYKELLNKYSLNPYDCIFIDDTLQNVKTASKLGIEAILVVPNKKIVKKTLEKIKNRKY